MIEKKNWKTKELVHFGFAFMRPVGVDNVEFKF